MSARGLAFYAPLKPPDHPTPSGDRAMARALLAALGGLGRPARVASTLRAREGAGDAARQDALFAAADSEVARLSAGPPIALWLTYHNYYKAPDLIGPMVAKAHGAAYAIVEPSRAPRRAEGPWARFNAAADRATDAADALFHMTERDAPALREALRPGQHLALLRPFLAREDVEPTPARAFKPPIRLIAVAMMREGDKLASFQALAAAMARVAAPWRLDIVGDGAARPAVDALFAPFKDNVVFHGEVAPEALSARYAAADLLVWPGVGEAYGLVYLEAQAAGRGVLAEDRPGVRDVARAGAVLTPPEDPDAFAAAIDGLAAAPDRLAALGAAGAAQVAADHLAHAARRRLAMTLAPLIEGRP